jgi:cardiolipin synthase A/B
MTPFLVTAVVSVLTTLLVVFIYTSLVPPDKKVRYQLNLDYGVEDEQFLRAMGSLLGPPFVGGNRVQALINGDEIFPAMLEAIRTARKTINLETYIYWSGSIGKDFAEALSERARAGVAVHVVLDGFGSFKIDKRYQTQMEEAGCEVEWYNPIRWYNLSRFNSRTHRKLLVVDGRIGFTGGVGIADVWLGNAQSPEHWRDSHFLLEGPAVAQMQAAFMDNWSKTRSDVLHDEDYFPPLTNQGTSTVQIFKSSPREGSQSVRLMYLLSIAGARRNIRLANSYFVPDSLSIAELVAARKRGVSVEIVVPGKFTDEKTARRASRARWGPLLESGCEIYEYQPTMYHCKVMIADDLLVSVGSTNFDNRSFRLNDEANMNGMDRDFAQGQIEQFEKDKLQSRQITLEEWKQRPASEKLVERMASLLGPQL